MITHYFKTLKDSELKTLPEPRVGVWTHVVAPNKVELASLVSGYGLDAAILEDSQDFFEVPRMEQSGGISYFFTRYPYDEQDEDSDTAPILFVMGETAVITVAPREVPQFKSFMNGSANCNTTQKTKLLIQLIGAIMKSYEAELVMLRRAVHRDRTKLRRIGPREIQRLVNHEHALNNMITALMPTNMWLSQVTKGNYIQLYAEDVALMEDLLIGSGQLIDSARSVLKTIQNVRGASEAIMTSTLNTTIKTLTIVTILLTIPNVVFSLFGMNVPLPLQESPVAIVFILAFVAVLIGIAVYSFKRNDWL
jgi:magnesium transporter